MPGPITPDLIYELTTYSFPTLAPDGSRIAFAQSKVDKAAMESRSKIILMSLPQGEASAFTQGPKDTSPLFSPNG